MLPTSASAADVDPGPTDELTKLNVNAQEPGFPKGHASTPQTPRFSTHLPLMTTPGSSVVPANPAGFTSPPPASSSITPPPSTQVRSKPGWTMRTPTPSTSLLSSPPPTAERFTIPVPKATDEPGPDSPTPNQIADASPTELRSYLDNMQAEVARLSTALANARTAAAHHKLQYTLLSIESDETAKRMAVEHEMTRREVEVLRRAELSYQQLQRLHELEASPRPARESPKLTAVVRALEQQMEQLRNETEVLRRRLGRAKKLIRFRDGEIRTHEQEGQRLRQRIRENREHINYFRRSLGVYDGQTPRILDSPAATPRQQPRGPRRAGEPRSAHAGTTRAGGPDTFAALLLADQVLSQGNAHASSTAGRARPSRPGPTGHSRGTQSLSALPPTSSFLHGASTTASGVPRSTPSTAVVPQPQPRPGPPMPSSGSPERRRNSRDSTISASDLERSPGLHRSTSSKRGGIVQESEASQLATHMLRRPSGLVREGDPARRSTQLKLQGPVKKAGVAHRSTEKAGKRPATAEVEHEGTPPNLPPSKRLKASQGVGLGIGA